MLQILYLQPTLNGIYSSMNQAGSVLSSMLSWRWLRSDESWSLNRESWASIVTRDPPPLQTICSCNNHGSSVIWVYYRLKLDIMRVERYFPRMFLLREKRLGNGLWRPEFWWSEQTKFSSKIVQDVITGAATLHWVWEIRNDFNNSQQLNKTEFFSLKTNKIVSAYFTLSWWNNVERTKYWDVNTRVEVKTRFWIVTVTRQRGFWCEKLLLGARISLLRIFDNLNKYQNSFSSTLWRAAGAGALWL